MPYRYTNASLENINKDGTVLAPALSFTPGTTPVNISRFAIGNRVRLRVEIERFGGDNWNNKKCRLNLLFASFSL